MKTTDLYFFKNGNIEEVKHLLESAFQIKFVPRDSYHFGSYYCCGTPPEEETFTLTDNIEFEGELHYPDLPKSTVMFSVGFTNRADEWKAKLEKLGAELKTRRQHH